MSISVPYVVLIAKQREIEELKRLELRSSLVGVLGLTIHALQSERGASSLYLASEGEQFSTELGELIDDSLEVEQKLREALEEEISNSGSTNAKLISLIAWILLGLDSLPDLRQKISEQKLNGYQSITAFSRLIAGLISLIFEIADSVGHPDVSRLLTSLYYLIEAKEQAGQERAVGALAFGSGICDEQLQKRILFLIDAQDRNCRTFMEFIEKSLANKCLDLKSKPFYTQLNLLRQIIRNAQPGAEIESGFSKTWFDVCSERITALWEIQCELVDLIKQRCSWLIKKAERELIDSQGLLESMKNASLLKAEVVDHFFNPDEPIEQALNFSVVAEKSTHHGQSVVELLQSQSQNLTSIENELASVKRALNERKLIERAKGILIAKYKLSEEEAHKKMRKTSMEQNLPLVKVAESILSLMEMN